VRSALLAAAEVGPFFRLEVHDHDPGPGWQLAGELGANRLADLAASYARQLGSPEPRVAASVLHLSLAARLWSPVLGSALLAGLVPDLSSLVVSSVSPLRLGVTTAAGWLGLSAGDLARLSADVVGNQLAALAAGLPVPVAGGLLRGNSASAMAGALGVLVHHRPGLAGRAAALGQELLGTTELTGAGCLTSGLAFRRRSCCLYYRVPGGGLCGDCCFGSPPAVR
jgi:FhuF-like iron-sulfur protein